MKRKNWLEQGATSMKGVGRYNHGDNIVSFAIGGLIVLTGATAILAKDVSAAGPLQEVELQEVYFEVKDDSNEKALQNNSVYVNFKSIAEEGLEEIRENERKQVSDEDIDFLARAIYAETGTLYYDKSLSPEMRELAQYLTGSAIINATNNHVKGAETLYETVYGGRYAKETLEKIPIQPAPEEFLQIARDLLENGTRCPSSLIYQSEFEQGHVYMKIGNTYYGLEPSL